MRTYISHLDYRIFHALNHLSDFTAWDGFFIVVAVYFAYLLAVLVAGYWFVNKDRLVARKAVILAAISGIVAREILANIIRALWHRNRPYLTYPLHDIISKTDTQASFPSGHAIAMFGVASVIYLYNKKFGTLLYVLSIATAFGRVIVGVHYPSDVVAGAILGILTGYVTVKLLDRRIEPTTAALSKLSDKILPFTKQSQSGSIT